MALQLPTPVAAYFSAEARDDFAQLAETFAEDGRVRDEGKTYEGRSAIAAWMAEAKRKYSHKTKPLSATERDGAFVVRTRLSGPFPGSPIEVEHNFRLVGDAIESLEIG